MEPPLFQRFALDPTRHVSPAAFWGTPSCWDVRGGRAGAKESAATPGVSATPGTKWGLSPKSSINGEPSSYWGWEVGITILNYIQLLGVPFFNYIQIYMVFL